NSGTARARLSEFVSRAYLTRALINEQLARLPEAPRQQLWWEAICFIERALLVSPTDAYAWMHLWRMHYIVGAIANSLADAQQAISCGVGDKSIEGECIILFVNCGGDEPARSAIAGYPNAANDPWIWAVRAYLYAGAGQYGRARSLID